MLRVVEAGERSMKMLKPLTNLDDADGLITDPRNAVSSYQFVKFYEVGPND